jgi:hypothetical protein
VILIEKVNFYLRCKCVTFCKQSIRMTRQTRLTQPRLQHAEIQSERVVRSARPVCFRTLDQRYSSSMMNFTNDAIVTALPKTRNIQLREFSQLVLNLHVRVHNAITRAHISGSVRVMCKHQITDSMHQPVDQRASNGQVLSYDDLIDELQVHHPLVQNSPQLGFLAVG